MTTLKVAVVGAGSMGREHIRAFSSLTGVEVAGIYSRTRARAETLAAEFGITHVTDGVAELRAQTGADLVVVAVPELHANAVAKECFEQDWAVLLEKPAGYDLEDATDIAGAAREHSRPVMIGFNRRFYSSVAAVTSDLDTRDENRFIHVQDQQSFEEARLHDHPAEVIEKFMYANSIHVIDLFRVFGRGDVVATRPIMPWKGESTEVVLVHLEFESGDAGLYEGLWKGPGPWACSVSTPSRRWVLQPLETADFQNAGERVRTPVEIAPEDTQFKAGFRRQAEAAVARVRGLPSGIVDVDESLRTMRLIHEMFGV